MSRLQIDWTRCDGHGLCAQVLPHAISVDEWGYPVIRDQLDGDDLLEARRAVSMCPALALRIEASSAPSYRR